MAPRKKRSMKSSGTNVRKTRSGVIYQPTTPSTNENSPKKSNEDKQTVSPKKSPDKRGKPNISNTKWAIEPMVTRSHKKFGKFRCLVEETDMENENVNKVGSIDEKVLAGLTAINATILGDNIVLSSAREPESDSEHIEPPENMCVIEEVIPDMEYEEDIDQQNETNEMSEQFSNLIVNQSAAFLIEPELISTSVANLEFTTEDASKSDMFQIDNLESEVVISEEVIPICEEQVVETGDNDNSVINELETDTMQEIIYHAELEDKLIPIEEVDYNKQSEVFETVGEDKESGQIHTVDNKIVDVYRKIDDIESRVEEIHGENVENIVESELEETTHVENENISNTDETQHIIKPLTKLKNELSKYSTKDKTVKKKSQKNGKSSNAMIESSVRRSNRIKSITVLKQKCKGRGLVVKNKSDISPKSTETDTSDNSNSGQVELDKINTSSETSFVVPNNETEQKKPVKVKSRWRRSSELEMVQCSPSGSNRSSPQNEYTSTNNNNNEGVSNKHDEVEKRLKQFIHLKENHYLTERISCKEAKKMTCDCFLTEEEINSGEYGCGDDCLNRLLMIECGPLCAVEDRCTNKRFQKGQFAPCEVFQTDKKGLGIRASANIPYGEFILEYVGEVLDPDEFDKRATEYSTDKNQHYYFMALRADAVIDATQKGNISRFINHSCDPNAETQKWTVNGELRIGFFSKRTILAGEEITFDYQFQRYGKEAQKCYCEATTCRGWLGDEPDEDYDDEDEDEEEEEEDEEIEKTEKIENVEIADEDKSVVSEDVLKEESISTSEQVSVATKPVKKEKRKTLRQRKPRKDIFEDLDLDEEIDTLQTTGLKNQAHTLKLSRLMVRAKESAQRTKLLRLLRRGELPCRRLFLDYHGLRLIHGWMTDAQHLVKMDKKLESLRLEILQTLAILPIPNKTMLQDSKVLPMVEKWSVPGKSDQSSPLDSESNSPNPEGEIKIEDNQDNIITTNKKDNEQDNKVTGEESAVFQEDMDISPIAFEEKDIVTETKTVREEKKQETDYEEEIIALALKLLEVWSSLKEVFRIPKKERIEQMKEHEREADRKYRAGLGMEQDRYDKKSENRYRFLQKYRRKDHSRRGSKDEHLSKFNKYERRKIFAMQVEQDEMERRRKQQELWRQHEQRCIVMGTDPRFTAPYDPNQGFHCIWNPQTGQWHNYPLPPNHTILFNTNVQQASSHIQQNQHVLLNQSSASNQLPSNQNIISISQPHPMLSSSHQLAGQQLHLPVAQKSSSNPHASLSQKLTPHLQIPLPGQMQSKQHLQHNQQFTMLSNPTSMNIPSNLNLNLPPNINIPPNISLHPPPNVNIPPNMNIPPNQHLINQHVHHLPLPNQQLAPTSQHMIPTNLPSLNQLLPSSNQPNTNFTYNISGNSLPHLHLPPLPITSPSKSLPPLPVLPYQDNLKDDPSQVKFMGPIPPPVKLPPKWKCAKDKYGRPYYYHIRTRKPQWEPPGVPPEENNDDLSDCSSSSDTSSLSSESSTEDSDSDDDLGDTKLLLQIKNRLIQSDFNKKRNRAESETEILKNQQKIVANIEESNVNDSTKNEELQTDIQKSLDDRLIEEFCLLKKDELPVTKKRRVGLVQEILISPRTDEDRLQFKEDIKRYKQNKEKLKRQKELILEQSKKHISIKANKSTASKSTKSTKKHKITVKTRLKEIADVNSEAAKKIKETFRSNMAGIMVSILNAYRKPDCKEGRITNTEDFKHLARKLTHFVMLKELKHCQNIEELTCTESVKSKAREFVRKYMSKFGESYLRPKDEADF